MQPCDAGHYSLPAHQLQAGACRGLNQMADDAGNQAEQHGGGEGNKPFAPKQAKAQISRQLAKAQPLQQRAEPADAHQRQKDNDEPADHAASLAAMHKSAGQLERMAAVAGRKAHGRPRGAVLRSEGQHFEQLTHFMLVHQLLHVAALGQAGRVQAIEHAAVE